MFIYMYIYMHMRFINICFIWLLAAFLSLFLEAISPSQPNCFIVIL